MFFDGETYDAEHDEARLSTQFIAVRDFVLVQYPAWVTLQEIADAIGQPHSLPGISARLRDMRKERFGSYIVERQRRTQGVWEYRANGR